MGSSHSRQGGRNEGTKLTLGRTRVSSGSKSFEDGSAKTAKPRNNQKSRVIGGKSMTKMPGGGKGY